MVRREEELPGRVELPAVTRSIVTHPRRDRVAVFSETIRPGRAIAVVRSRSLDRIVSWHELSKRKVVADYPRPSLPSEKVFDADSTGISVSSTFISILEPAPESTILLPKLEVKTRSFGKEAVVEITT